ncbi:MAG: acyl-CoA dehydratase activase [Candidatus Omnitrophica bacterium]|nr:acyl-CoA dehydratase activase [Candidatus Omnitrophota bacterium]
MIYAGIDAGSRMLKAVLWDAECGRVLAADTLAQGVEQEILAGRLFEQLLNRAGLTRERVSATVATGYGRNLVRFANTTITEITCHAWGVRHLAPEVHTIVEIGGQDSKLIRLNRDGTVRDFSMNDRCAAGTGRFLEMVAARLGVPLDQLGPLADRSRQPAVISSMCAVFAETEIIGLLASGIPASDIVAGVLTSVATRVAGMMGRIVEPPVFFTGGVALVSGMSAVLQSSLGCPVRAVDQPLLTGALGAAILAGRSPGNRRPTAAQTLL